MKQELVALAGLASLAPEFTEEVYGQRVGPFLGWLLARATGWTPLSIAEWILLGAIVHWTGRWITASRMESPRNSRRSLLSPPALLWVRACCR